MVQAGGIACVARGNHFFFGRILQWRNCFRFVIYFCETFILRHAGHLPIVFRYRYEIIFEIPHVKMRIWEQGWCWLSVEWNVLGGGFLLVGILLSSTLVGALFSSRLLFSYPLSDAKDYAVNMVISSTFDSPEYCLCYGNKLLGRQAIRDSFRFPEANSLGAIKKPIKFDRGACFQKQRIMLSGRFQMPSKCCIIFGFPDFVIWTASLKYATRASTLFFIPFH